MTGGEARDYFIFTPVEDAVLLHSDRITDFENGLDLINLHQLYAADLVFLSLHESMALERPASTTSRPVV